MHNTASILHDDTSVIAKREDQRFQEHLFINRLITDKEIEEENMKDAFRTDEIISVNEHSPDLFKIQQRNTNLDNYNFEQYGEFTRIHQEQMEKDRQKQYEIKRIFKYIKHNPKEILAKAWKRKIFYGN